MHQTSSSAILSQFGIFIALLFSGPLVFATDWGQPPAVCIEDLKPRFIGYAEKAKALLASGTLDKNSEDYNYALINILAVEHVDDKIKMVYQTANHVDMPPQLLVGAMIQESGFADQGIEEDGGGYSCGISAIQIAEWCEWGKTLSKAAAKKIKFPSQRLASYETQNHVDACKSDLSDNLLVTKVFFDLTWQKYKDQPFIKPHRIPAVQYSKYSFDSVKSALPGKDETQKHLAYLLAQSFLGHCGDYRFSIPAMAHWLRYNYDHFVPAELKQAERYQKGEFFNRACEYPVSTTAYPWNTAWLLAIAIDNAGEMIVPALDKYKTMPWRNFHPTDLVATMKLVTTTSDLFGKTLQDWEVVIGHTRGVVAHASILTEQPIP